MSALLVGAYLTLIASAVSLCSRDISRRIIISLVIIMILAASVVHQTLLNTLSEDAFITFRYSQNLADGYGAVFNIGERVEGYSNFLFMILLAAANYLFSFSIPETGRVAGSLFMVLSIVLTFFMARRLADGRVLPALIASLVLASSGIFVGWGPSGMETTLFGLLILLLLDSLFRNRSIISGIIVALATMTRPEGILLILVVLFWTFTKFRKSEVSRVAALRSSLWFLLSVVVILGIWTIWRVNYYGYLLPNPLAAKSGMDHLHQLAFGMRYLYDFASANIVLFFLVLLALIMIWARRARLAGLRLATPELMTIVFACLLFSGFYTVIGGDWMPLLRFYAPLIPLLALTIGRLYDLIFEVYPQRVYRSVVLGVVGIAAIANLMVTVFNPEMLKRNAIWQQQISATAEIGHWVRTAMPEGARVATLANGVFSYTLGSDFYVLDVLGLTDEHIARRGERVIQGFPGHIANDWRYVAEMQPSIIFLSGQGYDRTPMTQVQRSEFAEDYLPMALMLEQPRPLGRFLNIAVRKDQYSDILLRMLQVDGIAVELFQPDESNILPGAAVLPVEP